jgi:hypothetical protein
MGGVLAGCFAKDDLQGGGEGTRLVVHGPGNADKSEFTPTGGSPQEAQFPSNFVRISKYANYLSLFLSFTFMDFFRQVGVFPGRWLACVRCC